ncbi:MAG: hypothetical protein JXB45_07955 [Candidatus Krumholzibacteriota bacterium]|nr:hypothetical protein [Candidatus Krumholzibacteriota bacterium]
MKRTLISLISFIILALLVVSGIAREAEAETRISATLRVPNLSVRIGNTSLERYQFRARAQLPARRYREVRIIKQDRDIALRLARYAGVPYRTLIQIRRRGYSWFEIGSYLRLPRTVVSAAMHQQTWKHFLLEERRIAERRGLGAGRDWMAFRGGR